MVGFKKWMGDQTDFFRLKSKLKKTKRNLAFLFLIMFNTGLKVYVSSWEQFYHQVQICSRTAKILGAQIKKVRSTD